MTYINVINLIVAPVALTLIYAYALAKIVRKEKAVTRRTTEGLIITSFYIASLLIIFTVPQLNAKDILQLLLTVGLVTATVSYAISANEQAEASVKMAEEMKEQRYDAVRPVIDIQREQSPETQIAEALASDSKDTSRGLSCILHNIGLGPALDVYSFVQNPFSGKRQHHDFGTLATGGKTKMALSLSLNQAGNRTALVAYYRDVYGRAFESSREVRAGEKSRGWEVSPLKIVPVKEGKSHD